MAFGSFTGILHMPIHRARLREIQNADPAQFLPPDVRESMEEAVADGFYESDYIDIAARNYRAMAVEQYVEDLQAIGIELEPNI